MLLMLNFLLVVLIGVHAWTTILISLLVRRHHVLGNIIIRSSVHVRVEICTLIIVIGRTSFVVATTKLLLLALKRLTVVEVCARRIELLRRLKALRCKWWSCIANWKWLLLACEWLALRLLLRLLLRRRLKVRCWRSKWCTTTRLELFGQLNCCKRIWFNFLHHLLHRVGHLGSIIALNWLQRCCVGSCRRRLRWRKGHWRLLDRHGGCSSHWVVSLERICCRVHGRLLIYLVNICRHERTPGRVHLSWCRRWLKYLSIWRQVGLLLSLRLLIGRTCLRSGASYDKYICGFLLNKVL